MFSVVGDDRGHVFDPRNASEAAERVGWRPLPRPEWPPASALLRAPPPPNCAYLDGRPATYLGGRGRPCREYDAIGADFYWRCAPTGPDPLVLDDGAHPTLAPLLGWHGNGRGAAHFLQSLLADLCYDDMECRPDAAEENIQAATRSFLGTVALLSNGA